MFHNIVHLFGQLTSFRLTLIALLCATFVGCGGGTTGTGGDGPVFSGRVLSESGEPLANVEVNLRVEEESSAQTTSDANGEFTLVGPAGVSAVTLEFQTPGATASAAIGEISPSTTQVSLTIKLDLNESTAEVVSREDEGSAAPTPPPSPIATSTPAATPTPVVSQEARTRFKGKIIATPRTLISRASIKINSGSSHTINSVDGTFDFTLPRNFSSASATITILGARSATVALSELTGAPGSLTFRVGLAEVGGELAAEVKFIKFNASN